MKKMKLLAIVDQVSVKNACLESWENMPGNEKKRHCDKCNHSVTNLSGFSRKQAEKILQKADQKTFCVRYEKTSAGQINFKPNWQEQTLLYASRALACLLTVITFGIWNTPVRAESQPIPTPSSEITTKMGEAVSVPSKPVYPETVLGRLPIKKNQAKSEPTPPESTTTMGDISLPTQPTKDAEKCQE